LNDHKKPDQIADETVVTLDYTLWVDGEVVDTSDGGKPIQFIQGQQHIIQGLESELYGMTVGESREVVISPQNAYGELDPENFADIPRDQFPPQIPLEPGIELELKDQNGDLIGARIDTVEDESVRLDFNHPLAGKELHFSVTVVDLRDATDEEIAHGHVHEGQGHDH